MKKKLGTLAWVLCFALLALIAVPALAGAEGKSYGEPLTGTDTIEVSELLANADDYLGQVVRVEGLVTGVCKKRGCWISIASEKEEFKEIRIKVTDGVIVFPMEAKGRHAIAEGVLHKIEMTLEQTLKYRQHHAEEHGEDFDPSTVTEPLVYYQIQGRGAVIH